MPRYAVVPSVYQTSESFVKRADLAGCEVVPSVYQAETGLSNRLVKATIVAYDRGMEPVKLCCPTIIAPNPQTVKPRSG
jgi:hypothetical protein